MTRSMPRTHPPKTIPTLEDLAQEVADLHQIVRLLNERLAKLERG
jgi:ubiquinone biosynthesis protein UbiJ